MYYLKKSNIIFLRFQKTKQSKTNEKLTQRVNKRAGSGRGLSYFPILYNIKYNIQSIHATKTGDKLK